MVAVACFLPGRAKGLSAPLVCRHHKLNEYKPVNFNVLNVCTYCGKDIKYINICSFIYYMYSAHYTYIYYT